MIRCRDRKRAMRSAGADVRPWLRRIWWVLLMAAAQACLGQAGFGQAIAEPPVVDMAVTPRETIKLFDGGGLEHFYTFIEGRGRDADPRAVFSVRDGTIRISGEEWGCLTTNDSYRDYRFYCEFRWGQATFAPRKTAARDSGILIHSTGPDGAYRGRWMHSIECQLIEGGTGDLLVVGDGSNRFALTAATKPAADGMEPCYHPGGTPTTIHQGRINWWGRDPAWTDTLGFRGANDVEKPVGDWNRLEIVARGDTMTVLLNSVVVSEATALRPAAGKIQIQSEGAELFLRRVEVRPLEAAAAKGPGRLRGGTGVADITPEIGSRIVGNSYPVRAERIHDPLRARCLVLDDGGTTLALVVCDLCGFQRSVGQEARRRIATELGIPPENVMISATHTHSGGDALGNMVFPLGSLFSTPDELDAYQQRVVAGIVESVAAGLANRRDAELGFGTVEAPEYLFNRRWFLKPGRMPPNPFGGIDRVKMNPQPGSADLLEPAGPTDPSLDFLAVREPGGRPLGVFASYGLHYVGGVARGDISADYFGMFCAELAWRVAGSPAEAEPPFVALLANGASGDVNNIDVRTALPEAEPYARMREVAHDLAARVAAALPGVQYTATVPLASRFRELTVGTRVPTAEQVAWARTTLAGPEPVSGKVDFPRAYAAKLIEMADDPATVAVPLQVLRIGPGVLATMPCEVFAEIGLEFRRRSPLQPTAFVSLAHGYMGYLPTAAQHRLGGYETWLGTNSLETEAATRMLDTLVEMAAELDTRPSPPEAVKAATVVAEPFIMELVAAEPAVVDPVAITFDEQGRPYVAEYRDYPLGPPAGSPPMSRIVRLDDADGDGFYEGSTVVADNVPFAQGVLATRGGLLVTAAPDLLLLVDDDGDGRADRRDVVATGFALGNPQLRAACPQHDIDNSVSITGGLSGGIVKQPGDPGPGISIARRDVRIDLARGTITPATGFGQFGNAFDDLGRRFTTSNRNPIISIRLPLEALERNTLADLGSGFEDAAPSGAASRVYSLAATRATAASHTGTHTSACGMTVFRGDALGPDTTGDVFICEPVSHVVTRRRLQANGAGFTSESGDPEGTEFLASRDRWFRPVFTATGPDGALWVVDMCRGSVEHPDYMPPGMADTVDHRAGESAGRIWRIKRRGDAPRPWVAPRSAAEAVAGLSDPNGWRRSTCQRLLVERRFPDANVPLEAFLDQNPGPIATVHALWALDGLGQLPPSRMLAAARSPHAAVRETAARLAAQAVATDPGSDEAERIAEQVGMTLVTDGDPYVRLAATLAIAHGSGPTVADALAAAAVQPGTDQWIARGVLSGAIGRAAAILDRLSASPAAAAGSGGDIPQGCSTEVLADLVFALGVTAAGRATTGDRSGLGHDAADAVAVVVERAAAGRTNWFDIALLAGLADRCDLRRLPEAADVRAGCGAVLAAAGEVAGDQALPAVWRKLAIRLLGAVLRQGDAGLAAEACGTLKTVITTAGETDLKCVAVAALVCGADAAAAAALVESLPEFEPAVRTAAVTALLDRSETAAPLLAAIEAQTLSPAVVPLERRATLEAATDPAVRAAAKRIWAHASSPGLSAEELESLLATVRRGGLAANGRDIFMKNCGNCHQVSGAGHPVGPALAEAVERPVEQLVLDIVDPNRSVEPRWESTLVVTADGKVIEGILAESNADSVVLVRPGGERQTVPRGDIDVFRSQARSLMPEGFGRQIPAGDFADLVAFLRSRDR